MLKAEYSKRFVKDYRKLSNKIQEAFNLRLILFLNNPKQSLLHDHSLTGKMSTRRAFSVTGDIRVIYRYVDSDKIALLRIGKHSQVY